MSCVALGAEIAKTHALARIIEPMKASRDVIELSRFARAHPLSFVAAIEAVVIVVYLLGRSAASLAGLSDLWPTAIAYVALAIVVAIVLSVMGWWGHVGFHWIERKRDLLYFLPVLLPVLINLGAGVEVPSATLVAGLFLLALLVGFVEESVCRGLMLRALEPRGIWVAVLGSSVLFGLSHLLNLVAGKSLVDAGAQAFYTTALGFAFAALVWRTGVIWPLVVAHALIDFASFLQKPTETTAHASWVIVVGVALVYGSYGWLLLRRAGSGASGIIRDRARLIDRHLGADGP
jgi:membrane protease YdiL (CAAX protease family)